MRKLLSLPAFLILVCSACTSTKQAGNLQVSNFPNPDSFRTTDLFFLPADKQLQYFQNIDRLLPTNKISAGQAKYPLKEAVRDFSSLSFKYRDTLRTLEDFYRDTRVVGMIVIRNDSILYEHYREGTGPGSKWINFSVAKSITSLLYGAALKDGYIQSLDGKVSQYVPELAGSVYDSVSLHDLLQMSSGVAWSEDPRNWENDLMKVAKLERENGWSAVVAYLAKLKRAAPPGRKFNYNTIESGLAGLILKSIIRKPLADYLSEKIWKPFGMHADANWVKSRSTNSENGGCCISATLRDYALLGLFAMKNGKALNGEQMLSPNWIQQSTSSANSYKGYGYYWWLRRGGGYFASGSFGQQIEINPSQNTVIAVQSHWPTAYNEFYVGYLDSMLEAVMTRLNAGTGK